ncbi:MAG: hypothetical protein CSB55_08105 [Candidatus Cloacimonadota bacterium]|nr:MAG: hypothetical protein CSB55_08105 [Candidatus Cloacimonadota bacterium]
MQEYSKIDAQRRADQIRSFQTELEALENDKIITLQESQKNAISKYHDNLLSYLASVFDIDSNKRDKQLSLGMKTASFLGAISLVAGIFFLFYTFWGNFSTAVQAVILLASPVLGLSATMLATQKEKTGYFSKLFGSAALATFILNIYMLGQMFNITPSSNAFLIWGIFALLLAYATDARLLLAAGIICIAGFLSAQAGAWGGGYWIHFGERPENFFPVAILLFVIPYLPHNKFSGFDKIYRVFAMLLFFIPVLILSNWGRISYINFTRETVEVIYQIIGFGCSAAAIWYGIKKNFQETVNTGNVFFTVFLYTKFYDWWWDLMPKYLFFLLIGLSAILILLILKRLRNSNIEKAGMV